MEQPSTKRGRDDTQMSMSDMMDALPSPVKKSTAKRIRVVTKKKQEYIIKPLTGYTNIIAFTVKHVHAIEPEFDVQLIPASATRPQRIVVSLSHHDTLEEVELIPPVILEYKGDELTVTVYQGQHILSMKAAVPLIYRALSIFNNLQDFLEYGSLKDALKETLGKMPVGSHLNKNAAGIYAMHENIDTFLKMFKFPQMSMESPIIKNAKVIHHIIGSTSGYIKKTTVSHDLADILSHKKEGGASPNKSYILFNKRRYKVTKQKCIKVGDTIIELSSIRGKYRYTI